MGKGQSGPLDSRQSSASAGTAVTSSKCLPAFLCLHNDQIWVSVARFVIVTVEQSIRDSFTPSVPPLLQLQKNKPFPPICLFQETNFSHWFLHTLAESIVRYRYIKCSLFPLSFKVFFSLPPPFPPYCWTSYNKERGWSEANWYQVSWSKEGRAGGWF